MPLIRRPGPGDAGHEQLARVIADELLHGEEPCRPDGAPTIVIEPAMGGHENVTVVWDNPAWLALSREARGTVIMDAYDAAYGPEESLRIMFAMGLTTDEARRMNLPIPPAA